MSLRLISRSKTSKETPPPTPTDQTLIETIRESQTHKELENLVEKPAPPPPNLTEQTLCQQAFVSTAHLAKLLPTGTLLAFQLLTPFFSNNGSCDAVTRPMTQLLLLLLAASSFLASLTDSFQSEDGKLYHGLATFEGMWLFDNQETDGDSSAALPDLTKYRLRFIDLVHAVLSVLVFAAVALRDKNVLSCFYPRPKHETQEVLDILPLGIGFMCSMLFVIFPTRRHGIGFSIARGE